MAQIFFATFVLILSVLEGLGFMGAAEQGLYHKGTLAFGLIVAVLLVLSFAFSSWEKQENREDAEQGLLVNSERGTIMFAGYCIAINMSVLAGMYWLAHDPYHGVWRLFAVIIPLIVFVSPFFLALFFPIGTDRKNKPVAPVATDDKTATAAAACKSDETRETTQ